MFGLQQPTGGLKGQVCSLAHELAATWRWPTLAQRNRSELSHMVGAVDDSTINIVVVIIIIIVVVYAMHVTVLEFPSGRIDNCLLN